MNSEFWIMFGFNVAAIAFCAGGVVMSLRNLHARIEALDKTVRNGISAKMNEHSEQLAKINERCMHRETEIKWIDQRLKELS